jgi:hypothetical protein
MNSQKIEDIERAAWYARLAFGHFEEAIALPVATDQPKPIYDVLP